jgi:hypothetical protein
MPDARCPMRDARSAMREARCAIRGECVPRLQQLARRPTGHSTPPSPTVRTLPHLICTPPPHTPQAAEGGEEDPDIIAVYDSVCKDLDAAVTSGALTDALQSNGLMTSVDTKEWVVPVNFTVLQFQPTFADLAREEALRCYAQWMEGDPGHLFYPLKKPKVAINPFDGAGFLGELRVAAVVCTVRVRVKDRAT